MGGPAASVGSVSIPISTVSASGNFDALIDVIVAGLAPVPTCFDTGNSCLVLPYFEKISSAPNFLARYKVWPEVVEEPFGARARPVRGAVAFSARNVGLRVHHVVRVTVPNGWSGRDRANGPWHGRYGDVSF